MDLNKNVFSCVLKISSDGLSLIKSGSLFHSMRAAYCILLWCSFITRSVETKRYALLMVVFLTLCTRCYCYYFNSQLTLTAKLNQ